MRIFYHKNIAFFPLLWYTLSEVKQKMLNIILKNQEEYQKIVLGYMKKFVEYTDNPYLDNMDDKVLKSLEELKKIADLCSENISITTKLLNSVKKAHNTKTSSKKNINYNKLELVFKNTLQIQEFLQSMLPYMCLNFNNITNIEKSENTAQKKVSETSEILKNNPQYIENTLIISETKGKIFLPYVLKNLKATLKNSSNTYANLDEVLEKNYILSFDSFKSPSISRFREAFKLAKTKSNKSVRESFDLAVELIFNYNLHPAIITACKNLDELDIYLDYLESGETDKFDCFNIMFEIPPKLIK